MPIAPFFTKLPDIAAVETRELIILNNKNIPTGAHGLIESYCDEKWMRLASPELLEMMTHPHLEIRLARHYFLFKEVVNKENTGAKGIKIGRNESCPCGSGKKYKNCCGSAK
jgi:hypothetical protein